jgi:hypothetical protein
MEDRRKEARSQGFDAQRRRDGKDSNPHAKGTDLCADWLEGWMLAGMSIIDLINGVFDAELASKS